MHTLLRPFALAVPVLACAAALSGCDDGDASQPERGEAWIIAQIDAAQDLTPAEQAEHFAAIADDLAVATASLEPRPALDRSVGEAPVSEQAPVDCFIESGCISWNIEQGCVLHSLCYGCTDGSWGCVEY